MTGAIRQAPGTGHAGLDVIFQLPKTQRSQPSDTTLAAAALVPVFLIKTAGIDPPSPPPIKSWPAGKSPEWGPCGPPAELGHNDEQKPGPDIPWEFRATTDLFRRLRTNA